MKIRSILSATELRGKRVLVRVDLNIPEGAMEHLKLERAAQTIRILKERGAKIILATHLGRPEGKKVATLSTRRLVAPLQVALDSRVHHVSSVIGPEAVEASKSLKSKEILLLENLRYSAGEEKNDAAFAKKLAALADVYVNDGFAVSHRAHASVVGIAKLLPSYAGLSLLQEVQHLMRVLESKPKRSVVVIGGAKISTKIEVLERFLKQGSLVLIGGAMANNFFKARGLEIGHSLWDKKDVELARGLLHYRNLVLPEDVVVTRSLRAGSHIRMIPPTVIEHNEAIVDVGLTTLCEYRAIMDRAETIIWNGPMGISEIPDYAHGSIMLARTIAKRAEFGAYAVCGGGDTLPVLRMSGMESSMSWRSDGGGAMLEFLSGRMLPGLIPLVEKGK